METCDLLINKDSLLKVLSIANLNSTPYPTSEWYSIQFGRLQLEDESLRNAANFFTRMCSMRLSSELSTSEFSPCRIHRRASNKAGI